MARVRYTIKCDQKVEYETIKSSIVRISPLYFGKLLFLLPIEKAVKKGCRYLSLHKTKLVGNLNITNGSKLRYLDLNHCFNEDGGPNCRNRIENALKYPVCTNFLQLFISD